MRLNTLVKLLISIIACLSAGFIGSIFTGRSIPTWYASLQKPSFTPPSWLFAPVWTLLYVLMGVAAFLVWRTGLHKDDVKSALIVFLIQLILNALWSVIFFGFRSPFGGLVVIVVLWFAILVNIVMFFPISKISGGLLIPYILWVSFATALNYSIYIINR